jgi:hypothetical protein
MTQLQWDPPWVEQDPGRIEETLATSKRNTPLAEVLEAIRRSRWM